MKSKKRRLLKAFVWIAVIILFNIVALLFALQLPAVQTEIIRFLTVRLSESTGYTITMEKVEIDWLDQATFGGVLILDKQGEKMIACQELTIDYKLSTFFGQSDILIDEAKLIGPEVLLNSDEDRPMNINDFVNALKQLSTRESGAGKQIIIDHVSISDGYFALNAKHKPELDNRFDPNHFTLKAIQATLQQFKIHGDTIAFQSDQLSTRDEASKLTVHNLKTNFEISNSRMLFANLDVQIGSSHLKDSLIFTYSDMQDLSYFNDSVMFAGNFKNSHVYSEDLSVFVPYFNSIKEQYRFSGLVSGKVGDFRARNFRLVFGRNSVLTGNASFNGLPDITNTFMDISLNRSEIFEQDLNQYVNQEAFDKYNRFKYLKVRGSFTGYIQDFVANGSFDTDLGRIETDINLKIAKNPAFTAYTGLLKLTDFDLGAYANTDKVGSITMNGRIGGRGLSISTANFVINGSVNEIFLNNYAYKNIELNAELAQEFFEGKISINDPAIKFDADGRLDLRENKNEISVTGNLEYAHLDVLKLLETKSTISSKLNMSIKGFEIDSIVGGIFLTDLKAQYDDRSLQIDHLELSSEKETNYRKVLFKTNRASLSIDGDFNFTPAVRDLKRLFYEYKLNILNNRDSIEAYYSNLDNQVFNEYQINYTYELLDINRFLNLFYPEVHFSSDTRLSGQFRHGMSSNIALHLTSDTIIVQGTKLLFNELNVDASKLADQENVLAALDFISDSQTTSGGSNMDQLISSAVWDNNQIDFNLMIQQNALANVADVYGEVKFLEDTTTFKLKPSNLKVLDKAWTIQKDNLISLINNEVHIENLRVFSEDEDLTAFGVVSKDPAASFTVTANNLELGIINPLINKELHGVIDGGLKVANPFNTPIIESDFRIKKFQIVDFIVGDIAALITWNNSAEFFDVDLYVEKDSLRAMSLKGTYNPWNELAALDLSSTLNNADLKIAEPFMSAIFSEVEGSISGNIRIKGPVFNPQVSGQGTFNKSQLKVNYLNTLYQFDGGWRVDSSQLYLENLQLADQKNNNAVLNATFSHERFKNFRMDLNGTLDNFTVMNTTEEENSLFYGTGIVSGDLSISGPLNNLLIQARATTNKDTKFYIPIGGASTTSSDDFISFVNFTDTIAVQLNEQLDKAFKLSGISMKFDLEITPDAYAEIIFDRTVGDIIRGTGRGNISMAIDTKGEFTMFGEYEFVQGGYNFTMYNIVNKEFIIEPRSKITWAGNPYSGNLNIDATYEVITSLSPLVDTVYHDQPDVQRNYPSKVKLNLQGPLLNPDIAFAILIEDYPRSNVDLDTQVRAFLNKIETDEQELNRQVFSLLILRSYSPPNSFATGGTLGSSVSEFISNQLSYWISQVDENLTIDIDLGQLDENALNTFQLRVSYAFLDGKLIVTRDGGFTDPTNNQATVASVAGDWTVEYLLSQDGKLRVKLFKKTNYNQLNSALGNSNQSLITGGFSLIYTTSFNRLRDIFGKNQQKPKKKTQADADALPANKPNEEQGEGIPKSR